MVQLYQQKAGGFGKDHSDQGGGKMKTTAEVMYVGRYKDLFIETENPIYAWRAFQNARAMRYAVPEEVLDYMGKVAHEIEKIAQKPPAPAQRPVAISKALKLHKTGAGQGSFYAEYHTRLNNREIALDTAERVTYYGQDKKDYAYDDMAVKHNISKSKVRRIYLDHKKRWQKIANDLIESGSIQKTPDGKIELQVCGTADDFQEAAEILSEIENIS
jgi:hypothetical protein